nr:MAG TPA: hypothetical protein [Microviridae sp.]
MRKGRFYLTCRAYTPCIHPLCYSSEAPSCVRRKFELSSQIRLLLSINAQLTL